MDKKLALSIMVSIFAVIFGFILNFQEALMGSPATVKNLLVTVVYIVIWIVILTITAKSKNRRIMGYYSMFWLGTLIFAILTCLINVTEANADWAIPFVALLLTQWYGIELLVDNFLITSIIITLVSLIVFIGTLSSVKRSYSTTKSSV